MTFTGIFIFAVIGATLFLIVEACSLVGRFGRYISTSDVLGELAEAAGLGILLGFALYAFCFSMVYLDTGFIPSSGEPVLIKEGTAVLNEDKTLNIDSYRRVLFYDEEEGIVPCRVDKCIKRDINWPKIEVYKESFGGGLIEKNEVILIIPEGSFDTYSEQITKIV